MKVVKPKPSTPFQNKTTPFFSTGAGQFFSASSNTEPPFFAPSGTSIAAQAALVNDSPADDVVTEADTLENEAVQQPSVVPGTDVSSDPNTSGEPDAQPSIHGNEIDSGAENEEANSSAEQHPPTGTAEPDGGQQNEISPSQDEQGTDFSEEQNAASLPEQTPQDESAGATDSADDPETPEPVTTPPETGGLTTAPSPPDTGSSLQAEGPPGEDLSAAPDSSEVPGLGRWRSSISSATGNIPAPALGEHADAPQQLRQQGAAMATRRQAARPDFVQEASQRVPDAPQVPDLPQPDENPVLTEANRQLQPYSDRTFPQQSLPALHASPRNTLPHLGDRPSLASPPATGAQAAPPVPVDASQTQAPVQSRGQQQVEQAREVAAEELPQGQTAAATDHITLTAEPVAPQAPLPVPLRANITQVLARLLADPQQEAGNMLDTFRRQAYPREILADPDIYPDIGNAYLPQLTASLTTGLRLIATEAGVAEGELNVAIEARRQALETARQATGQALDAAHQEQTDQLHALGQEERNAIAGAREAVDLHTERQLEAANGEEDPEVVRSRRDRFIEHINSHVGRQRVAYDQAKTSRERQIDQAEATYILAYRAAVQRDQQSVRTDAPEGTPEAQLQLQSAVIRNWGAAEERAVHNEVLAFKTQVTGWTDSYKSELESAADQQIRHIQDWAAEQLHEQTSWWQALMQRIRSWASRAREESAAWEQVRAGENRDAMIGDMAFLIQYRRQAGESVDATSEAALQGLTEEQRAIVTAYYGAGPEGRDPIAALAAGLRVRISQQQQERVITSIKSELDDKPPSDWERLDRIGQAQNGSFSADHIRSELRQAMFGGITGWGTDEDRIFSALASLTHEQSLAVKKVYFFEHHTLLETDLNDELGGAEQTRASALLTGDQALADVATLHEAMHGGLTGLGTDESVIMRTLRGKSPEERQRIISLYQQQYGVNLQVDLDDELGGLELDQAGALMQGDVARADAAALQNAMEGGITGWGTDEAGIQGVYADVRQDVETEAAAADPPHDTAWVEAEIARRNQDVEASYNVQYGNHWQPGDESALRQAYAGELSGPELDLTNALADADLLRADAARIAIEAQGIVSTDDAVVNGVLRNQYDRALREVRRDEWPAMERDLQRRSETEHWDRYRYREEERILERALERSAQERSTGYMSQLEERYDSRYNTWGYTGLRNVIDNNVSGEDQAMARQLMQQGGQLSPAQELHYATAGIGTREEDIRRALTGRSPEEIEEIRAEWSRLHPDEDMDTRVLSELSGRDEFDTSILLRGEPRDAHEEMAQMRDRFNYELENTAGALSGEQQHIMRDRMTRLEIQYGTLTDPDASPEAHRRAVELFQYRSGNVQHAIDVVREQSDAVTDSVTTVVSMTAAIAAAIAITVFTAGTAGPAVIAALAALGGSLTATASQIITRRLMQGAAYGWEDIAVDMGVGAIDAIVSVATAGVGGRLIEFASEGSLLFRLARSPQLSRRIMAHVIAEGAEGFLSSLPSALAGNVLNDENWEHGNPLANIALGTALETGIGTAVSGGIGGLMHIRSADPNIRPHDIPEVAGAGPHADVDVNTAHPGARPAGLPVAEPRLNGIGDEIGQALPARSAETEATLRRALPEDLQGRIPVSIDPELTGNTVRVHYDRDANGLVRNVHMRVGPEATAADLALHARTVRSLEEYSGLSGRLYQVVERMQGWLGRYGEPPIGSMAFEARLELDKLPRIIEQRANQLASGTLDAEAEALVRRDIEHLYNQLDQHRSTLAQIEVEPSRGFVAAEGVEISPARRSPASFEEIIMPPALRDIRTNLPGVMNYMRQLEIEPVVLQHLLDNIPQPENTLRNVIGDLNILLKIQTERNRLAPQSLATLLEGLGNPRNAEMAQTWLRVMVAQTGGRGVNLGMVNANRILRVFNLDEINDLIRHHSFGSLLEHERPASDFFTALHNVVSRVDEPSSSRIRQLINSAGLPAESTLTEPDVFRLSAIVDRMAPGRHGFTTVENAIIRRNEVVRELEHAGGDLELILFRGLDLELDDQGRRSFGSQPHLFMEEGEISGALVMDSMRRDKTRVQAVVNAVLGRGGSAINELEADRQWIRLERLLNQTDLPDGPRGNLLGFLWERVNIERLERSGLQADGNLFEQVAVAMSGLRKRARPDAIIVEGIEEVNGVRRIRLRIEEYKAGRAVLTNEQEALQDVLLGHGPHRTLTFDLPQHVLGPPGTPYEIDATFNVIRSPSTKL